MPSAKVFAPAKINLTLHVTGQRGDGLHLLDSLVVFADVGDWVRVRPAPSGTFSVIGPMADGVPVDDSNLVVRAAKLIGIPADILLEKHLPAASGIGGGSSDAAATMRALSDCFGVAVPDAATAATLGADVPVCLGARPCRMTGIGDELADMPDLPPLHFVLVNPGVSLSTPQVFAALSANRNRPMPSDLPEWKETGDFAQWLARQTNDLELPARGLVPAIGVVLARLAQTGGCLLARMSGSGATCFGLYATRTEAEVAAREIAEAHADWWVAACSEWSLARN